jgi:hypothetical protein
VPAPASAQGFFESLFGWGSSSKSQPAPPAAQGSTAPVPHGAMPGYGRAYSAQSPFQSSARSHRGDDDEETADVKGTKFKTVCVRACDGFYFPISSSTTRKMFNVEGQRCRSLCGDDARLYYMPTPEGEIGQAIDLSGRSYVKHINAFKYRKTRIEGCTCRPEPWSDASVERHRRYAEAEAAAKDKSDAARGADQKSDVVSNTSLDKVPEAVAEAASDESPASKEPATPVRVQRRAAAQVPVRVARAPPIAAVRPAGKIAPPPSPPGALMGLGGGGAKYRWPGD